MIAAVFIAFKYTEVTITVSPLCEVGMVCAVPDRCAVCSAFCIPDPAVWRYYDGCQCDTLLTVTLIIGVTIHYSYYTCKKIVFNLPELSL